MASEDHYHIFHWHHTDLNSQGVFHLLSFFASLILVFTLFLCVHYCRCRFSLRSTAAATAAVATSPLPPHQWVGVEYTTHSMHPLSSITNGLADDGGFEKKECCICLSVLQENEKLMVLKKCQHAYHSECLDRWLSVHPNCPICRTSLHVRNVEVE